MKNVQSIVPADMFIIKCDINTDTFSNGNEIKKNHVTFNCNGKWALSITDINVDIHKLWIDCNFTMNKEGVQLICKNVDKLTLCAGIPLKKSTIVTRFNIFEDWQSSNDTTKLKIVRSMSCVRVTEISKRMESCIICRRMTFQAGNESKTKIIGNEKLLSRKP